jgi:hypothetical protein
VSSGGHAFLDLAAGQARMASGAVIELRRMASDGIELVQVAGRVYHRVAIDPQATYAVRTGALTWTARGTAFDLELTGGVAGSSVQERSLEHSVHVVGPGIDETIPEGRAASIPLGGGPADGSIAPLSPLQLADPWLVANAQRDFEAGYPLGVMTGLAVAPTSSAQPSDLASAVPVATDVQRTAAPAAATSNPSPASTAASTPSPKATLKATPRPSPTPTTAPTAAPTLGSLSLSVTPCDGSFVVVTWSKWLGSGFHHYQGLRSGSSSIPVDWPPQGDVAAPEGLYSSVATTNNGIDVGLTPGTTTWYRVVAFDAGNTALAASAAQAAAIKDAKALGPLAVSTAGPTSTAFSWTPYAGPAGCFSFYKLVYSATNPSPSYLEGDPYLWASSAKTDAATLVDGIPAGTYWFRLQALRDTPGGRVVIAQTDVSSFTVP